MARHPHPAAPPHPHASAREHLVTAALFLALVASFLWVPSLELYMVTATLALLTLAVILTPVHQMIPPLPHRGGRIAFLILAALTIWIWARAFTSDIPATSILQAGYYGLTFLAALALVQQPKTFAIKPLIIASGTLGILITCASAWVLFTTDDPNVFRAAWPYLDANHLAMTMNALMMLGVGVALHPRWRAFGVILLCAGLIGLTLSGSRAGLLGLLTGMFMFGLRHHRAWPFTRPQTLVPIAVLIAATLILSVIGMATTSGLYQWQDIVTDRAAFFNTRPEFWAAILDLIATRPVFGFGTGTFSAVFPAVIEPHFLTSGYAAHNDFLQIWLETGLIGAVLYAGLMLTLLIVTLRVREQTPSIPLTTSLAIMAAIGLQAQIEFMLAVLPLMIIFGLSLGVWIRSLPAPQPAAHPHPAWQGWTLGLVLLTTSGLSLTQVYSDLQIRQADRALVAQDIPRFSAHLTQAQFWSLDLYALPHLRAANFHLALLISSGPSDTITPDHIRAQLAAARARNPYLSATYETSGRLAEWQNQSPIPDYLAGLRLDPRNAPLRLNLLKYYERMGMTEAANTLAADSLTWYGLRGLSAPLYAHLKAYQK